MRLPGSAPGSFAGHQISMHLFFETCSKQSSIFFLFKHTIIHQDVTSKNLENENLNTRLLKIIFWKKSEFWTNQNFSKSCWWQCLIFPFQKYNYTSGYIIMKKISKPKNKCYAFEHEVWEKNASKKDFVLAFWPICNAYCLKVLFYHARWLLGNSDEFPFFLDSKSDLCSQS